MKPDARPAEGETVHGWKSMATLLSTKDQEVGVAAVRNYADREHDPLPVYEDHIGYAISRADLEAWKLAQRRPYKEARKERRDQANKARRDRAKSPRS